VVELNEPWAARRLHIATARGRSASPITSALMKQLLAQPREEAVEKLRPRTVRISPG
jgi:hypothetical protein